MANLILIKQGLEQGNEYCGYCGQDVTGAADCMHSKWSDSLGYNHASGRIGMYHHKNFLERQVSLRIGEEYLLYLEELSALPMFDRASKYIFLYNMQEMFSLNSVLDTGIINSIPTSFRFEGSY